MKKVVYGLALLATGVIAVSRPGEAVKRSKADVPKKAKILVTNVEEKALELEKGEKFTLELEEEALLGKRVKWTSSNKKVAKISKSGKITARKVGKARIMGKIRGTKKKTVLKVTVYQHIKMKKVKIKTKKHELFTGDTLVIKVKKTPKKNDDELVWESSDEEVLSVSDEGKVTARKPGAAIVTVSVDGNKDVAASKKFTVRDNTLTQMTAVNKKLLIGLGHTEKMTLRMAPDYVTDKKIEYRVDDPQIATVDADGNVTGWRAGKTKVHAVYHKNPALTAVTEVTVSRTSGKITKEMLDSLDLSTVHNLMIVAHPDDETIFGGGHLISDKWLVVCMTRGDDPIRSVDFGEAMDYAENERIHLDYSDDKKSRDYLWEYDQLAVLNDIRTVVNYKKWNTIATSNPEGDYGHRHHKKVNELVTKAYNENKGSAKRLMYFGKYYKPEQLTDSVKRSLTKLNDNLFRLKMEMADKYEQKHWTFYTWLWHILPYENWIYSEDWK